MFLLIFLELPPRPDSTSSLSSSSSLPLPPYSKLYRFLCAAMNGCDKIWEFCECVCVCIDSRMSWACAGNRRERKSRMSGVRREELREEFFVLLWRGWNVLEGECQWNPEWGSDIQWEFFCLKSFSTLAELLKKFKGLILVAPSMISEKFLINLRI